MHPPEGPPISMKKKLRPNNDCNSNNVMNGYKTTKLKLLTPLKLLHPLLKIAIFH